MISYPIDDILPALKETIISNSSVVLHAPPGAGKTTRVPLALLDLLNGRGHIVMLEPRRIAAVSAARWMAHLLGEEVGMTVGYSIRFDSRKSEDTRIEVVTEGILTRRIQADPTLEGVAMVIFDEFHERSLHADLALALCLDARRNLRDDLKILVMSATLDCEPIATLLEGAPIIVSSGKAFPVEERYISDKSERSLSVRVARAVSTALNETSGDVLVFMPGAGEIRACSDMLSPIVESRGDGTTLHPLYGDLPFEEQERAIMPSKTRKIVLATNIAETSLTIEGVKVVIDSGLTRRLQYDSATGMNRLITVSVSKAAAEQRKGRAGRLGPGSCYRLYSRHDFQSMVPFTPPEILVSDLSSLVLELAAWGENDASRLSWLDTPPSAAWDAAKELLVELGALDPSGAVTSQGRKMARLPLHPRLSGLMTRAVEVGCIRLGADLAALLSERDIIRRGTLRSMIQVQEPDISSRLDILRAWRKGTVVPDRTDKWAARSADRTSGQLMRLMLGSPKAFSDDALDHDIISRLLIHAFPDRMARRREDDGGRFVLVQGRGVRFTSIGSLSKSPFIVAAQMDAGEKGEGIVHIAAPLTEKIIREECSSRIETIKRIEWDKRESRIAAAIEERLGAMPLSVKPFQPSDEDTAPILCGIIKSTPGMLIFTEEARQFKGRVTLMRRTFPDESWPDLSDERLAAMPEEWLIPWLVGIRSAQDFARVDILSALRTWLSWPQRHLLDDLAPTHIAVPSGHRVHLDYVSGDIPVLAVKLQEMFGLADTPAIARGRVKVLLHLLSPARRPLQITQDLKGFWDGSYQQVKKEMKGRYPKHPWPDDPWNALPTRKTKARST
jgi:ATP-dependent helicase HrpB